MTPSSRLRAAGIKPNVVTHDSLMVRCVRSKNITQMDAYIAQMGEEGTQQGFPASSMAAAIDDLLLFLLLLALYHVQSIGRT